MPWRGSFWGLCFVQKLRVLGFGLVLGFGFGFVLVLCHFFCLLVLGLFRFGSFWFCFFWFWGFVQMANLFVLGKSLGFLYVFCFKKNGVVVFALVLVFFVGFGVLFLILKQFTVLVFVFGFGCSYIFV